MSAGANRRVLIVDDNRDIHDDFRRLLGRDAASYDLGALESVLFDLPAGGPAAPSFELSFASQGAEGFDMIAQAAAVGMPYALVFMDMRMPPGWDGLETLERVWTTDPAVQAVICTAYSDYSWEQITERFGATDRLLVLKKPFDALEVRQLALAMTEKWNQHHERERTEAHLRGLLRALPDALALVGEGGLVHRSQIPRGFPRAGAPETGIPISSAFPERVRAHADERLRRVLTTGAGQRLEYEAGEGTARSRFEARWERVDSTQAVMVIRALSSTLPPPAEQSVELMDEEIQEQIRAEERPPRELPLPVVPLDAGVIVVPLTGAHGEAEMELIAGALISAVVQRSARILVLDGSCLPSPSDAALDAIAMAAQTIRAAGVEVVLTGLPIASSDDGAAPICCDTIDEGIARARSLALALG
jgi:CheY-like chemotaxis protein/anti-anti-sigma regulatory factor